MLDTDGVTCLGMRGPARVGGREADPNRRRPQGPNRDEGGKEGPVGATVGQRWGKRRLWGPGAGDSGGLRDGRGLRRHKD